MRRATPAEPWRSWVAQNASVTASQHCFHLSRETLVFVVLAIIGVAFAFVIHTDRSLLPGSGKESYVGSFGLQDQLKLVGGMRCEIQEISGANMSALFAEHRMHSQPARIQNVTAEWKLQNWVEPAQFRHLLEDAGCCVMLRGYKGGDAPSDSQIHFSLERWDELARNTSNVVFNVDYSPIYWALKSLYIIPQIFRGIRKNPILSLGSHGSGIFAHQHDANFLTQVQGTKLWFIAPPEALKLPMRHPCSYIAQRPPGVQACAIRPGETIYLPDRWHHATCNLGGEGAWGLWNLAVGGQGESTSWPESFHALADGDISRLREALRQTLSSLSESRRSCSKCGGALWRQLVALLHFAARAGSLDGLKVVLDEVGLPHDAPVVEVDARDLHGGYGQIKGGTALHVAAWHGHLMLVQELVRHGAEVRAELQGEDAGLRASELAKRQGHLTTAIFLSAEEARS